ncbi:hypothetical protein BJX76DRAFT_213530 [Aspergillus varians]
MSRYQMGHSYPMFIGPQPSNVSMHSNSSSGSNSPYERFLSPSPTRSSVRGRRTPSVVSSDYSDYLVDASQHHRGRRHTGRKVRNSQLVNPDIIDRLDTASLSYYHHEGPYDAVYPERNRNARQSPIEALRESNAEALRATPYHKIADSVNRRRPLDGVAYFPPGHTDQEGQTYDYEEGYNMMNEYGNFGRMPGQKFTDDDFRNDPFYNMPAKPFAPIRNVFRRKYRAST